MVISSLTCDRTGIRSSASTTPAGWGCGTRVPAAQPVAVRRWANQAARRCRRVRDRRSTLDSDRIIVQQFGGPPALVQRGDQIVVLRWCQVGMDAPGRMLARVSSGRFGCGNSSQPDEALRCGGHQRRPATDTISGGLLSCTASPRKGASRRCHTSSPLQARTMSARCLESPGCPVLVLYDH